ncbi:MAG: HEAT repeat domain-containing protein [Bacteroidota bacterium]
MSNKEEDIIRLFPEYLEGVLDADKAKQVEKYLAISEVGGKELKEYESLLEAFKNEEPLLPSGELKEKFQAMLENEKAQQQATIPIAVKQTTAPRKLFTATLRIAAGLALLLASYAIGHFTADSKRSKELTVAENQVQEAKQIAVISLLENQSASKRIQGVQYIEEFTTPDTAVIDALVERLLQDENTNVRLSAMEALSGFRNSQRVKLAFIQALKTEKDPSIQIAIIQNLVQMQEKKAIGPMQDLLQSEETQPFIKEEITNALPKII